MSKLTEFYQNVIDMCGLEISSHGRLVFPSVEDGEEVEIPLTYDSKPIVFPDKQYVNDPENKGRDVIVFHPLSESSLRAPSEVMDLLRKAAIIRLNTIGTFLLNRAVALNHNATLDEGAKLNHKLANLFNEVPDIDVKFVTWFEKIQKAVAEDKKTDLFNIFIKMHGTLDKKNYDRLCVVSSPLYDELKLVTDDTTILGVSGGRKKDINALIAIMESLFSDLPKGGYLAGSSNGTAPTLMSFMEAMSLVAGRFNKVLSIYGREAKGIDRGTTKGIDFDRDVDLSALRSAHPVEEYNIGVGKEDVNRKAPEPREVEKPKTTVRRDDLSIPKRDTDRRDDEREERRDSKPIEGDDPSTGFWTRDDRDDRDYRRRDRDDRDRDYDRDYDRRDRRDERRYRDDDRDYRRRDRDDRDYDRRDRRDRDDRDYRDDRYDRDYDRDRGSRYDERHGSSTRNFWER